MTSAIAPVRWEHDRLVLLDQRLLPGQELERVYGRWEDVADAIRTLAVRGAPAIGVAAAFGVVVGMQRRRDDSRQAFVGQPSVVRGDAGQPFVVEIDVTGEQAAELRDHDQIPPAVKLLRVRPAGASTRPRTRAAPRA